MTSGPHARPPPRFCCRQVQHSAICWSSSCTRSRPTTGRRCICPPPTGRARRGAWPPRSLLRPHAPHTIPGPFSAYAGESRVFRMVYAEGGHYTPLLQRARDLWRELEASCGTDLLHVTGVVTIMDQDHPDHSALLRAGRERGVSFEVVTGEEARRRLPQHVI